MSIENHRRNTLCTQYILHDRIFGTVLYYASGAAFYFVIFIGVLR